MNQAENIGSTAPDLERDMLALGRRARDAAAKLATAPTGRKQAALQAMATRIRAAQADLLARVEQISGRAFLEAFETLKGGGQITEIEGQRATQAIARLQRTQSPEAFQEALFEFADIVRRGIERSRNELRILPEIAPATQQTQAAPAAPAPAPAAGTVPQGFLRNQNVIDAAAGAGVTPEQMWAVMSPEQRARYGE